jgi:hypothetical protein
MMNDNHLVDLNVEKLSSLANKKHQRHHRLTFAVNDTERAKILRDRDKYGFYGVSDYIRDRLVYQQKEGRRRLISQMITRLSQLGEAIEAYQGNLEQLKAMVAEEISQIIKEID